MPRTLATNRILVRDFGSCLSLSGAGSTNTLSGSAPTQGQSFTMAIWVNPNAISFGSLMTFNQTSGADLVMNGASLRMSSVGSGGWASSSAVMKAGIWQHVIFTRTSGNVWTYYYNGVAAGTGTNANGVATTAALFIGQEAGFGGNYAGKLDEAMYWNTSISAAEALALYTTGIIPQSANLQIYYKFDDGSGTSATDSSGNGNTGTLNGAGATWSTNVPSKPRTLATNRTLAVGRTLAV